QLHVSGAELPGKACPGGAIALRQGCPVAVAAHQPRDLLARVAGGTLQVAQHHRLVAPAQTPIGEALEHCRNEVVALDIVAAGLELDGSSAIEKGAKMRHRVDPV